MKEAPNIKVFASLSDEELIAVCAPIVWFKKPKNTILLAKGDTSRDVYFVATGEIRATNYSISGKEVSYQDLSAGEMFGELSAIDGKPRTTSILALTDVEVGKISHSEFWHLIEKYPAVMKEVMLRLAELTRFLVERVFEYSALDVKDRIRVELIRRAIGSNSEVNVDSAKIVDLPTHDALASQLATHREAVTKEFSYLIKSGYLEKSGPKEFLVPNVQRLKGLVEEAIYAQ